MTRAYRGIGTLRSPVLRLYAVVPSASDPRAGRLLLDAIAARWPTFRAAAPPDRAALQRLLDDCGAPWRLIGPSGAYEPAIANGCIPTRDGSWHDAFNVLAFVAWPRAKAALHARTLACQQARKAVGVMQRGREEDALALLDETALVFSGSADAIARFEAARTTGDLEAIDEAVHSGMRVRWFGHALLEHIALDRPPIGAGVWAVVTDGENDDAVLARQIAAGQFTAPCFAPFVPWPHAIAVAWTCAV